MGRSDGSMRRRTKGKRGQTIVHFQVQEPDGPGDVSAAMAYAIQRRKSSAGLRMSHDTFINSAFLLQGRADEFTTRKPTERKQVLADILGLADYEELEARAKARRATCDAGLHNLDGLITDHQAQVDRRPFLLAQLAEAFGRAGEIDDEVTKLESRNAATAQRIGATAPDRRHTHGIARAYRAARTRYRRFAAGDRQRGSAARHRRGGGDTTARDRGWHGRVGTE